MEIHEGIYLYYGIPPKADFYFIPSRPKAGEEISFIDNSTTSYGRVNKWLWEFGDGNVSHGEIAGLKFDEGDRVKVDMEMNESFTVEMWLMPFFSFDDGKIHEWFFWYGEGNYITCFKHSNNRIYFVVKGEKWEAARAVIEFDENEWHHFAGVYNKKASTFYLYWDGKIIEIKKGKGAVSFEGGYVIIGGRNNRWFNGCIKDVRIYNRALNGIEIQQNYEGNITTAGLMSWWKFDEGYGNIAHDSYDRINATIYGAKWMNYENHVYEKPGEYNVTLTVWNEDGLSNSISKKVAVL